MKIDFSPSVMNKCVGNIRLLVVMVANFPVLLSINHLYLYFRSNKYCFSCYLNASQFNVRKKMTRKVIGFFKFAAAKVIAQPILTRNCKCRHQLAILSPKTE